MTASTIAVVTFHFVPNYGAIWQTYALQKFLTDRGHDVSVIDYRPSHVFHGGRLSWPFSRRKFKANLVTMYQHYCRIRSRLRGGDALSPLFEHFTGQHINLTKKRYRSIKELRRNPPAANVLLCGSDQIWNPSPQFGLDPAYFLSFGQSDQLRVAYAPSFGRPSIESEFITEMKGYLDRIDAISVREESGSELVSGLMNHPVVTLPDPTLLHQDYPLAERPAELPKQYIFSYVLRSSESIGDIQRDLARERGMPIISPTNPHLAQANSDMELVPSPTEWLGLIRDASAVITNSFHGTLFSVIFKKPFVTIGIGSGKSALNERALSMLGRLGLSDRLLIKPTVDRVRNLIDTPIDWGGVDAIRSVWRSEAEAFFTRRDL